MAKTKYPIELTPTERAYLQVVYDGAFPKTKRQRAAILLRADECRPGGALSDWQIAEALDCSRRSIHRVRRIALADGVRVCIEGRYYERPHVRKITGEVEAKLIALCCSEPPSGRARWTLRLLADKLVELEIVDSIDHSSLHHCLKKMNLNLGESDSGASPQGKTQPSSAASRTS